MSMSLKNWLDNGWLRPHKTSKAEIEDLLKIVERDLKDSSRKEISADWRFGIAYNAALKLCTILLYSEGYRPEKNLAHFRTIQALPFILGTEKTSYSDYLDTCRIKRNSTEYDYAGGVSDNDAEELKEFVYRFKDEVMEWLKKNHSNLFPD